MLPFHVTLSLNGINLNQEFSIKYLGIIIDSKLSWKSQVSYIAKKIKRNIGILSKLRYYVNLDILVKRYYALINISLLNLWFNFLGQHLFFNYPAFVHFTKESNAMRVTTFSKFHEHSSPANFQTLKCF